MLRWWTSCCCAAPRGAALRIFICLGHQLAAASHIRLIKRAVREVQALTACRWTRRPRARFPAARVPAHRRRSARRCRSSSAAKPWRAAGTTPGSRSRRTRASRSARAAAALRAARGQPHVPGELHETHALIADELEGVIDRDVDRARADGRDVPQRRGRTRKRRCSPTGPTSCCTTPSCRSAMCSPSAPCMAAEPAVRGGDPGQTRVDRDVHRGRHHLHLLQGLGDPPHPPVVHLPVPPGADGRHPRHRRARGPRYHELKNNDGVRLLIRLLYHGMQE